jgi:hypothetical protein
LARMDIHEIDARIGEPDKNLTVSWQSHRSRRTMTSGPL